MTLKFNIVRKLPKIRNRSLNVNIFWCVQNCYICYTSRFILSTQFKEKYKNPGSVIIFRFLMLENVIRGCTIAPIFQPSVYQGILFSRNLGWWIFMVNKSYSAESTQCRVDIEWQKWHRNIFMWIIIRKKQNYFTTKGV